MRTYPDAHAPQVSRASVIAAVSAAAVLLAACSADPAQEEPVATPTWTAISLPPSEGAEGRAALRDAVRCGDSWYVVGGVLLSEPTETQDSRPAAWRSTDGTTWEPVPITTNTYWGHRAVLLSAACSNGELVAVGARAGGAHAYPRVTTFFEEKGGLDDQLAAFNLFGGATACNVGPISGAGPGWLITGNRVSGPAVWHSTDGRNFTIEEDVVGLADETGFTSLAQDGVWDGSQWVAVGGGNARDTIDREPLVWVSTDARSWERQSVDGTKEYDDLERVVGSGEQLVALGLRGDHFGVWVRDDDSWHRGSTFGAVSEKAHASPFVSSLGAGDRGLWATISDGHSYALWNSEDGYEWLEVAIPEAPPETGGDRILGVATHGPQVLLLSDDGTVGRLWMSHRSG